MLDKEIAFKALQMRAKAQVHTLHLGHHLTRLNAQGHDFSELREYQPGDDIRSIHWMSSAKLGKPYIKVFHANRELSVVVAAFMDASLYFGAGNAKQHTLAEVATLLGYASAYHAESFQGFSFSEKARYVTPITKEMYPIETFSKAMISEPLLGTRLDYPKALHSLFTELRRPSLLFVLSDFLEEVDLSLLAQKHEVIAITIRDKEEISPCSLGEVSLREPQSQEKKETYLSQKAYERYLSLLSAHDAKHHAHCKQHAIKQLTITTAEDPLLRLLSLFP